MLLRKKAVLDTISRSVIYNFFPESGGIIVQYNASPAISAQELIAALDREDPIVVVDCRSDLNDPDAGPATYRNEHVRGAVYAHLDRDLASQVLPHTGRHPLPTVPGFEDFVGSLGIRPDTPVVVYDDANGAFAARLWWMLTVLGHRDVRVLEGGIQAYKSAFGPLDAGSVNNSPVQFVSSRSDWPTVTSAELAESSNYLVVDARAAARFRGDIEPIDAVAGHVPGAMNLPFEANLTNTGEFLSPQEIQATFSAISTTAPNKEIVVMCGSGVTACHLLLARAVAGLPLTKLYAGSWSEWIRDPGRPVATGTQRVPQYSECN